MQTEYFKSPNPSDVAVIEDFFSSISWAGQCVICQRVGRDRVWLRVNDKYVLVPVDCENYPDNLNEVFLAADTLGVKPGAIFYGKPTDYLRDEINYNAYRLGIVVYWAGVENCFAYDEWLSKISDGVDLVDLWVQKL